MKPQGRNLLLLVGVDEVSLQVLGHAEALDLLCAKDGGHGVVRGEPLPALGILQSILLEVGPQSLGCLRGEFI